MTTARRFIYAKSKSDQTDIDEPALASSQERFEQSLGILVVSIISWIDPIMKLFWF
ncbi:MAG: hypothetical protein H6617_06615 [Bdellovibrionaceae bacterium]|nr:hypothetical protein [Pseudobdellovibrionaceae bacterium]